MNLIRDYNYYETHAADVNLSEITSSNVNKRSLQQLRDGTLEVISIGEREEFNSFVPRGRDDLGWLGYFISRSVSLQKLFIEDFSDEEREQQIMRALSDGIGRNTSIKEVFVRRLCNNGFAAIAEALGKLTQLEEFYYQYRNDNNTLNDCNKIGTLLDSGVWKLKELSLSESNISDAGVVAFAHGLKSIRTCLEHLDLHDNSFGSEGLSALAEALTNCTCLKSLDISDNDFSTAAAGLRSLSDTLQTAALTLVSLDLWNCEINDEGLQALAEKAVDHCTCLKLIGNGNITASGWKDFSTSLVNNKVLDSLVLRGDSEDNSISPAGWSAFSKLLCDNSTINNISSSNHKISYMWDNYAEPSEHEDLAIYLKLNEKHPRYAARSKILMHYNHLDVEPLLRREWKCLPSVIDWFETCTTLSRQEDESSILGEPEEVFQSRVLTALYEFVRVATEKVLERRGELILVAAYDAKISRAEQEKKRLREDVEERDKKMSKLEEENERLRGIVQAAREGMFSIIEGLE